MQSSLFYSATRGRDKSRPYECKKSDPERVALRLRIFFLIPAVIFTNLFGNFVHDDIGNPV